MYRIIGLDAAFTNVGIAMGTVDMTKPDDPIVDITDLRLIHTAPLKKRPRGMPRSADDLRRARESLHAIQKAIKDFEPHFVVAEVPFGSQSARASWALGIAIGVLASIPDLIEVTPREVKAESGEPDNDKDGMIEWAMDRHPTAPWAMRKLKGNLIQVSSTNEHLADAVAAIYAGLRTKDFKRAAGIIT